MVIIHATDLAREINKALDRVEAGECLVVVRDGKAIAEIRPVTPPPSTPRPFGLAAGAFTVPEDFDSPLSDQILSSFEQP